MDESEAHNQPEQKPAPHPVMDVVPPKPAEAPKAPPKEDAAPPPSPTPSDAVHHKPDKAPVNKPPKQHNSSGVGLAIFASVIVILGLAALFVYAYLRSKNITVF